MQPSHEQNDRNHLHSLSPAWPKNLGINSAVLTILQNKGASKQSMLQQEEIQQAQ